MIQKKHIILVGGGPGGLTLARLLQLKGVNVKLYERAFNAAAPVQLGSLLATPASDNKF